MAKRKQQQTKQTFAGAYQTYQKIAQDEARRVPWPELRQVVEESLRWEVFVLWIRAVINAANGVPPVVERELESRIPGFLARVREELESPDEVGERLWNLVGARISTHVLLQPKVEGWLNAEDASVSLMSAVDECAGRRGRIRRRSRRISTYI